MLRDTSGVPFDKDVAVVMAGISKMFVGEVIEGGNTHEPCVGFLFTVIFAARSVMEERGEKGPIHPRHIRESYQRMQRSGRLPYADTKNKLLK